MTKNTEKKPEPAHRPFEDNYDLEPTRLSPLDEVENARILFNEGLLDEAKKRLFRVLTREPDCDPARKLLVKIDEIELKKLFQNQSGYKKKLPLEDIDALLEKLDDDLGLELDTLESLPHSENEVWHAQVVGGKALSVRDTYDLGIAFHQMGFHSDALRELRRAEKKIRIENTFLDLLGISIVALIAQILIQVGRPYEARLYLEPILTEPDLNHEDKIGLYYEMAQAEEALSETARAKAWYQKILAHDPHYKDVAHRLRKV